MTDSFEQISAHNEELARDIVERASARGVTVSTAESLTAGMIASTIADIPGASAVLRGGAVTYCDEIKHRVLGVEQETLDRYTAVSHQTAREMAVGSLELYQSDIAVSATGYAGPGGGTEDVEGGELGTHMLGQRRERGGVAQVQGVRAGQVRRWCAEQAGCGFECARKFCEGFRLRRTQRQAAGDGVLDACIHYSFSPNKPPCPVLAAADLLALGAAALAAGAGSSACTIGRLATLRL